MPLEIVPLAGIGFAIVTVITIGRLLGKLIDRRGGMKPKELAAVAARLERIEQAIDTMAVEVERISEGQRFTTKLLAERSAREPEPRP